MTDHLLSVRTRLPARRVRTVLVVLLALALASAVSSCGADNVAVPPPLAEAITAMQESGGYSFTATIDTGSSSVTTVGDFQAPNRIFQTVTRAGSTPVAMVLDGASVHVMDPSTGAWSTQPSASESTVDLRSTFAALTAPTSMTTNDVVYSFTLAHEASKTLAGSKTSGSARVTATVGEFGLSQLTYQVTVNGQPITVTINYSNVGVAPKVTVPA